MSYITPATLARVVGVDERGMAKVDAVMGSAAEEKELEAAGGRRTWGKEREEEELVPVVVEEGEEVEEGGDLLRFLEFDTKRSWPKGAVGEELTRWSKDKSWLLAEVVKTQLSGGSYLSLSRPPRPANLSLPNRRQRASRRAPALLYPLHPPTQLLLSHLVQIPLLPPLPLLLPPPPHHYPPPVLLSTPLRLLPRPLPLPTLLPRHGLLQRPNARTGHLSPRRTRRALYVARRSRDRVERQKRWRS